MMVYVEKEYQELQVMEVDENIVEARKERDVMTGVPVPHVFTL